MMRIIRRVTALLLAVACLLCGCSGTVQEPESDAVTAITATTYPVYYLTWRICGDIPGFRVTGLIQEPVSCLHNYTITTGQMKLLDRADLVVLNGAGMEEFLEPALQYVPEENQIDSSEGIALLPGEEDEFDPHIWLSPELYAAQCDNIAAALAARYPASADQLLSNASALHRELDALQQELTQSLSELRCRELITFHDGFSYFAQAFDLTIAAAVEEEEGAETPARELKALCAMVEDSGIPALFSERNGSVNACSIISQETGVPVFVLNTMIDGQTDYFTAMRQNAETVREALS